MVWKYIFWHSLNHCKPNVYIEGRVPWDLRAIHAISIWTNKGENSWSLRRPRPHCNISSVFPISNFHNKKLTSVAGYCFGTCIEWKRTVWLCPPPKCPNLFRGALLYLTKSHAHFSRAPYPTITPWISWLSMGPASKIPHEGAREWIACPIKIYPFSFFFFFFIND
jgi:hypothetical protein